MISWLLVIILAYFLFSLVSLGDKLILDGKPNAVVYTFYVGFFTIFLFLIIPFINFGFPSSGTFLWIILEAVVYLLGLYLMYTAVEKFDVSKVITTIGATQPIFVFALTWIFWGSQMMKTTNIIAFIFLVLGSIIISVGKNIKLTREYLKITTLSSLMFSLDYVFSKFVFLDQPFLQGFLWTRIFIFLFSLLLLLSAKNRKQIFQKKVISNKKTNLFFAFTQMTGGGANILQYFAIFLAPVAFLPIINSLRGIQYVFLFIMTLFMSFFLPKILKEETSKKAVIQKIISIILIAIGLALLVL